MRPDQIKMSRDESKDELIMVMTHELKGSLMAVQGLVDVMLKGYVGDLNERQQALLKRITRRIDSLMEVSTGLWDYYHYRFGRPKLERVPLNIKEAIQNAVDLFKAKALQKDLSIHLNLRDDDLMLVGTEQELENILHNLITNAIKYTPEGGNISIDLSTSEEYLILRVRDTGIGIAAEDAAKIFDEFFRTREAKKIDPYGRGLGLPFVKRVVEAMGGTISVISEKGKGTEFLIRFPKK
jgi:two-component system phosphate regulon sensor histidine kinase PhoR